MLPRSLRLHRSDEIATARKEGQQVKHRLAVLIYRPNPLNQQSRFGFSASKHIGNAVERNRAKRLLREAVQHHLGAVAPHWDCWVIARSPTPTADFSEVLSAVLLLLRQARLLSPVK